MSEAVKAALMAVFDHPNIYHLDESSVAEMLREADAARAVSDEEVAAVFNEMSPTINWRIIAEALRAAGLKVVRG